MIERVFRPLPEVENEQYLRIKNRVFSIFPSGHINDVEKIIYICKVIYDEHETILKDNIRKINMLSIILFVLEQYQEYAIVNSKYNQFDLSAADEDTWQNCASHARRGMKYLLEYLCMNHTNLQDAKDDKLITQAKHVILSRIFVSIEEMCSMYIRIDGYKFLYDSVDLYLDEKQHTYFRVPMDLETKNRLDIRNEKQQITSLISGIPYSINIAEHSQVLEPSFSSHLGLTYGQLITFLRDKIKSEDSSVRIVSKDKLIAELQRKFGINTEQAKIAIHGFSLRKINLQNRELYSPKQEHRAYHRGFFEFTYNDVPMLLFSRVMALEALDILINNTCYQKLPEEWITPTIANQLTTLSNNAGKWFEDVLHDNLSLLGIRAIRSLKSYRWHGKTTYLPQDVGEIDFIGHFPEDNALFVIEAKNVRFNTEPRLFRDDLSKFIKGNKSYVGKFNAKCLWVQEHLPKVIDELNHRGIDVKRIDKIYKVMVIHSPSPVESKINAFSCMNIVKFVEVIKSSDFSDISVVNVSSTSRL